jgi:beta-alanine degradation protein BauB
MDDLDPTYTDPDKYKTIFENDRVRVKEVALEAGRALWRPAEIHTGENIGTTDTHVVFVELKDST